MPASDLNFADPKLLENYLSALEDRVSTLEQGTLQVGRVEYITQDLGDQRSGTFFGKFIARASGITTEDPTDPTFIGSFMNGDGEDFGGLGWIHVGGVNLGELEFGISASDGAAYIGGGKIKLGKDGMAVFSETEETFSLEPDGDLFMGEDVTDPDKTYFAFFSNDQDYNDEAVLAGTQLWGSSSAGMANMIYDPALGRILFRNGKEVISSFIDGEWHVPYQTDSLIRYYFIPCIPWGTNTAIGDGAGYIVIPPQFDGKVITYFNAIVGTPGTTNNTIIQLYNETKGCDMLSIPAEILSGGKQSQLGVAGVIDSGHDDVSSGDILRVDVDGISSTPAKGLGAIVGFYDDLNITYVSQPDATVGMDNELESYNPNSNYGTQDGLLVGTYGAALHDHTLIKDSFSTIPSNAVIVSAVLSLTHYDKNANNPSTIGVYRMKLPWTETGSTWNKYDGTHNWGTAGGTGTGDRDTLCIGTLTLSPGETNGEKKIILNPAAIQEMTDETMPNYGFWIGNVSYVQESNHWFYSSDWSGTTQRPKFTIEYYVPTDAGVTTLQLDDLAAPDDNIDLNASTSLHGLLLKAVAPAAGTLNVVGIANGDTLWAVKTLFDGDNPAAVGTPAPGTSLYAAHRDHVHGPMNLDDCAAPDDNIDLNVSISKHGLTPKLPNDASLYLNGIGSYTAPAGSVGGAEGILGNDASINLVSGVGYAETVLKTISIPANTLDSNSHLHIIVVCSSQGSGPTVTWQIRLGGIGGTIILSKPFGTSGGAEHEHHIELRLSNNNAQNAQRGISIFSHSASVTVGEIATAANFANALDLVITASATGGTSSTARCFYFYAGFVA